MSPFEEQLNVENGHTEAVSHDQDIEIQHLTYFFFFLSNDILSYQK